MKRLSAIFVAGLILVFSSCNDNTKEKENEDAKQDSVAVVPTPVIEPVFTPFKTFVVKQQVKNFAKWQEAYMAHDSMRQAYGISNWHLGRGITDSNTVIVIDKINDEAKAKEFAISPSLKDAMQKAGVISKLEISYYEVIRNDDSKIEFTDRVMVIHKVKDWNTWLKVFDAEGKAKRAENGLIDRGLSRSLNDSNTVRIVFAISDMAKAKARVSSDELKKIMTDAGVEGKPEIFWYRLAN